MHTDIISHTTHSFISGHDRFTQIGKSTTHNHYVIQEANLGNWNNRMQNFETFPSAYNSLYVYSHTRQLSG